jgi:23S rRNA-intervening sequence protein
VYSVYSAVWAGLQLQIADSQRSEIRGRKSEVRQRAMQIRSAKELDVYKKGYELAMRVFEASRGFPSEEKYALTSQIRRSSRSVCLNLREAWAKRRYEAHFISKLTDCDGENSERRRGQSCTFLRHFAFHCRGKSED